MRRPTRQHTAVIAIALAVAAGAGFARHATAVEFEDAVDYALRTSGEEIPPGSMTESQSGEGLPGGAAEYVDEFDAEGLVGDFGDAVLEEDDFLFPEDTFFNSPQAWYASAEVTLLQRQSPRAEVISTVQQVVIVGGQAIPQTIPVLTGQSLDFHVDPGLRATIGRNFYRDLIGRQHSVEFTFLGTNRWHTTGFAQGFPGFQTQTLVRFANLFTGFPVSVGGFNNASQHRIFNSSDLNNYELNYRIKQRPRRDRLIHMPDGSWTRQGNPSLLLSWLGGVRWVSFNDRFRWESEGTNATNNTPFSGLYRVATNNNLIGAQIGADLVAQQYNWSFGMRSKIGIYGNNAQQLSQINVVDPIRGNAERFLDARKLRTAVVADLGFTGTLRLWRQLHFRGSYDFMWLGGLAVAPEQLEFSLTDPARISTVGHLLFQGVSLGLEGTW